MFAMLQRFFRRRRAPTLFAVVAGVFVLNLLIPDGLPFVDELLLAAATALLGSWRRDDTTNG